MSVVAPLGDMPSCASETSLCANHGCVANNAHFHVILVLAPEPSTALAWKFSQFRSAAGLQRAIAELLPWQHAVWRSRLGAW